MNIKSVGKYGKREYFAFFLPILYFSFACLPSPFQDFIWIGRLQVWGVRCRIHRLPIGGRTFWACSQTIIISGSHSIIYQGEATKDGDENEGKKQRAEVFRRFTLSCSLAEKLRLLSQYDEY